MRVAVWEVCGNAMPRKDECFVRIACVHWRSRTLAQGNHSRFPSKWTTIYANLLKISHRKVKSKVVRWLFAWSRYTCHRWVKQLETNVYDVCEWVLFTTVVEEYAFITFCIKMAVWLQHGNKPLIMFLARAVRAGVTCYLENKTGVSSLSYGRQLKFQLTAYPRLGIRTTWDWE